MKISKIFWLLAIAVLMTTLNSCSSNASKEVDATIVNIPVKADGTTDNAKMPVITFETTNHDFGDLMQGEKRMVRFHACLNLPIQERHLW